MGLSPFRAVLGGAPPALGGAGGARIPSQDGCTVKLEPSGKLTCMTGVTEQGQETDTMIAQVVASAVGVAMENVRVLTGDTIKAAATPAS
ncbi:MAG: molybdopterin-dependent oxidoreductase [Candidatus Rokubacteria bacterium]|nr:molybdopterin-dependent oxidoreductase [Candidatus Rokubacteria bacterium]